MPSDTPIEIDVHELQELLNGDEDFVFLDCREPNEYEYCHIEAARLLPLGQIPGQVGSLESERGKRIVILCHHGVRSLTAASWLRQQGFDRAQSVSGGIDAWSNFIDPDVPKY